MVCLRASRSTPTGVFSHNRWFGIFVGLRYGSLWSRRRRFGGVEIGVIRDDGGRWNVVVEIVVVVTVPRRQDGFVVIRVRSAAAAAALVVGRRIIVVAIPSARDTNGSGSDRVDVVVIVVVVVGLVAVGVVPFWSLGRLGRRQRWAIWMAGFGRIVIPKGPAAIWGGDPRIILLDFGIVELTRGLMFRQ